MIGKEIYFIRNAFRRILLIGCTATIFLSGCRGDSSAVSVSSDKDLREARRHLEHGRVQAAEKVALEVFNQAPESTEAMLLLAQIRAAQQDPTGALDWLSRIQANSGPTFPQAMVLAARMLMAQGAFSDAESRLRQALEADPASVDAHQSMAELLTTVGRRWESIPHLFELLRRDMIQIQHLLMLADQESVIDFSPDLQKSMERQPTDPLPRLALARIARKDNDLDRALHLVREALERSPGLLEAQATLGHLLLDAEPAAFANWHKTLTASAWEYPEIWHVHGRWAEAQGNPRTALRCYGETLVRNPNHRQATYRLGRLLRQLGRDQEAAEFESRAKMLDELVSAADTLLRDAQAFDEMQQAAELTQSLGRLWEAHAWYRRLAASGASQGRFDERRREIAHQLAADTPLTLPSFPAGMLDLASLPLPEVRATAKERTHRSSPGHYPPPRFVDRAAEVGLDFRYNNGDDASVPGWEIYNELGGGIAVADFDADGWPDLFLTQGTSWPPPSQPGADRDRMFRNLRGAAVQDVTSVGLPAESAFGQGVAAADFNNDGFTDLYIANLGRNRLLQNQGDGVFLDVSDEAGIETELWTSSCLIADLNGDAMPDLYDVNYLAGDQPFIETCLAGGVRRACSPDRFDGEQDQLLLNLGNGRFENVTSDSGIVAANGKGLGIVAADFDRSGRLSLFVANDATPNFYFRNIGQPAQPPQFTEQGIASGLAFDGNGRSEACMGIAFDDADRDGRWDLFVTNFFRESNTLYRQQSPDQFSDDTRRAGLDQGSLAFTGFGTQFLDAELDGFPDLVALNGHIDDLQHEGIPFQMRARYFSNRAGQGFQEAEPARLGDYFSRPTLGRALATLDWNRDGKPDLLATHLDVPAALLINETTATGHFLKVRLSGTQSCRDAIGAVVRVTTPEGATIVKQLVAGDGYQASNERMLTFGLGEVDRLESLHIQWPSGMEETWHSIPCDQEVRAIEGAGIVEMTRE